MAASNAAPPIASASKWAPTLQPLARMWKNYDLYEKGILKAGNQVALPKMALLVQPGRAITWTSKAMFLASINRMKAPAFKLDYWFGSGGGTG